MSWSAAMCYPVGLLIILCAIAFWPKRKRRGLAKPVHDSRSSIALFDRLRGLR